MPAAIRLLITVFAIAIASNATSRAASPLPCYAFTPGQEMTYRTIFSMKYTLGDHTGQDDLITNATVWVLHANADGSYRLVICARETSTHTSGVKKGKPDLTTWLVRVDLFPDGRQLPMKSTFLAAFPTRLFPPLPANETELVIGWDKPAQDYQVIGKPIQGIRGFEFDARVISPFDTVMQDSCNSRFTFDLHRGLMAKSEDQYTRRMKIHGEGGGTTELLSSGPMRPEAFKQLTDDADPYFDATEKYSAQVHSAIDAGLAEAPRIFADAARRLKEVADTLTQPDLKSDAADYLREHGERAASVLERAKRFASRTGKPAPDFTALDLSGKSVRLADLRGKVVVLDFNFRGCGPCLRSIPQMNQLVTDFSDQPVAIYSMSVDKDRDDAKFMAQKMGLTYPTLLARAIQDQFGVTACPTMIIIDQHGIVRHIEDGYSPTLRSDVGQIVRQLLKTP